MLQGINLIFFTKYLHDIHICGFMESCVDTFTLHVRGATPPPAHADNMRNMR